MIDGRGQLCRRVAIVCGDRGVRATAHSGAAEHLKAMCRGFVAQGAQVELWCQRLKRSGEGPLDLPSQVPALQAPSGRLPGFLRRRVDWDHGVDGWAMGRWARAQGRRFRPQLIYERFSLFANPGLQVARELGVPYILELNAPLAWEGALYRGLPPSVALLDRESRALTAADWVRCVSPALVSYALRRGVAADRILLLPNGAEAAPSRGPDWVEKRAVQSDYVLGYAGSFKAWQGLVEELPALCRLAAELAPRRLLLDLWGVGPERENFLRCLARFPELAVALHGWGSRAQLCQARQDWDAAWVPQASWPPSRSSLGLELAELERRFGEPAPEQYFSPLKEAEALMAGVPVWRGAGFAPERLILSWQALAGQVLHAAFFPGSRSHGKMQSSSQQQPLA